MIPKGIQNAEAIIDACRQTLAGLGTATNPEWKAYLEGVITVLEEMKTKFFLRTNLAIPPTNACRKDAAELQSLVAAQDLARFPDTLNRFRSNIEALLKSAKMEGVIIT